MEHIEIAAKGKRFPRQFYKNNWENGSPYITATAYPQTGDAVTLAGFYAEVEEFIKNEIRVPVFVVIKYHLRYRRKHYRIRFFNMGHNVWVNDPQWSSFKYHEIGESDHNRKWEISLNDDEVLLKFRRLPKRWIPAFDQLVKK